jgi:hypothetical protein
MISVNQLCVEAADSLFPELGDAIQLFKPAGLVRVVFVLMLLS